MNIMTFILKTIYYYWLMFLKTLEKYVQKFIKQTFQNFSQGWHGKTKVELELLTNIDMLLLIVKKRIGGGIYHSINMQKLIIDI